MSPVKLVARTLDVFALYAARGEPLSLTGLSHGLQTPMSSTLSLVRTLVDMGYLYRTRKRTYYPTKKLLGLCRRIDEKDPVLELLRPFLERLRDRTGETVVLGKREDFQVLYLEVEQCNQSIRYSAQPGERRHLHSNSIGKALLCAMEESELRELFEQLELPALTGQTLHTKERLIEDLQLSRQRGWAVNIGESVRDLAAIAAPFHFGGQWYAMSVVGPLQRIQGALDDHATTLRNVVGAVKEMLRGQEGD